MLTSFLTCHCLSNKVIRLLSTQYYYYILLLRLSLHYKSYWNILAIIKRYNQVFHNPPFLCLLPASNKSIELTCPGMSEINLIGFLILFSEIFTFKYFVTHLKMMF